MTKTAKIITIATCLYGALFAFSSFAYAANISAPLQIPISGTGSIEVCVGEKCSGVAQYISLVYRFLVGFAAVLAVLALTWGGVRWLTSGGESGKIQEAQKVIGNAVVGLVIALLSYAGLYLINPDLTQFKPLTVKPIKGIPLSILDVDGEADLHAYSKTGTRSGFQDTCVDDYHKLNPEIQYSATAEDVFKQLDARIKDKCYFTHTSKGEYFNNHFSVLVHENIHKLNSGHSIYLGGGRYMDWPNPFDDTGLSRMSVNDWIPNIIKTIDPHFLETYITGTHTKNIRPFGLLDEFTAFIFDNTASYELIERKYPDGEMDTGVHHTMKMMIYNLALARMTEDKEPAYLATSNGILYRDTLREMIETTMTLYAKFRAAPHKFHPEAYEESYKTYNALKNHPEAEKIRDTTKRWYGNDWTNRVLGF